MFGCLCVCVSVCVFAMIMTRVLAHTHTHTHACTHTYTRHLRQLNRHSEEDQAELTALVEDRTRFLHIAVKNYILCLKAGVSGPTYLCAEKATTVSHFVTLVCFHGFKLSNWEKNRMLFSSLTL